MESNTPPSSASADQARLQLVIGKAIALLVVFGLLILGLAKTQGVLAERQQLRAEAIEEISASWGKPQTIVGPVLEIPVTIEDRVEVRYQEGQTWAKRWESRPVRRSVWVMPDSLNYTGTLAPERRFRGMYEAVVYRFETIAEASFELRDEDFSDALEVHWTDSRIVVGLSDARSLRTNPALTINGKATKLEPAIADPRWEGTVFGRLTGLSDVISHKLHVRLELNGHGTSHLNIAPLGEDSHIALTGAWTHPSFQGPPLPTAREVSEDHFSAQWDTTGFARGFPQVTIDREGAFLSLEQLEKTTIGVRLLQPLDSYRLVERSLKYGILFIVLVFTVFLLFEILAGLRLHPVQYLLVGAALTLFFLGFLALSEVIAPAVAYFIPALATTLLITVYVRAVLGAGKRSWSIFSGLIGIYSYLYFVLQSESYALLAGTFLLFAVLGGVMWSTRNLNWYRLKNQSRGCNHSLNT